MKNILIIILYIFLIPVFATAQTEKVRVWTAGGGKVANSQYQNFSSFGQPVTQATVNSEYSNREGFIFAQQNEVTLTVTGNQTICYNTVADSLSSTLAGAEGIPGYQWQVWNEGSWKDIGGEIARVIYPGALTATGYYRLKINDKPGKGILYSDSVTITVRDVLDAGSIDDEGESICEGGETGEIVSVSEASGGNENLTYAWYVSTDNFVDDSTLIAEASTASYNPPDDLTETTYFRRYAKDGVCSADFIRASGTWTVYVETVPISGSLSKSPDEILICQGDDVSATLTPGSGGNDTDSLAYRTHDGSGWSEWQSYISGSNISTAEVTHIEILTLRIADYCVDAKADTVRWSADVTPPVVTENTNVTVTLDPTGNYTLLTDDLLDSYTDAGVGIQTVSIMPETVNCNDIGSKDIVVTVTDNCDNPTVVNMTISVVEGTSLGDWDYCNTQPSASGTSTYSPCTNNGTFYLTSKGKGSATSDVMHFVYKPLTGNGTIIARLADVKNDGWAGVMMRESCAPGSRTVLFKTRLYNPNVLTGYRKLTDKTIYTVSQVYQQIRWMKIQRNGNTFLVYVSYNGTTWIKVYTTNIAMNNTIMAGIFTENFFTNRTTQAWFDHVELAPVLKSGLESMENDPISMTESPDIQLYPNPADQHVTITLTGIDPSETGFNGLAATLISSDGKIMKQFDIRDIETLLNLEGIQPGVYMVRFENMENVIVKRLIVQ